MAEVADHFVQYQGCRTLKYRVYVSAPEEQTQIQVRRLSVRLPLKNNHHRNRVRGKRSLRFSTQEAGRNDVLVHVADNGVGIPEQMKSRLFSPSATTKQESGSGLGLWVSCSILEKHDAREQAI